jgi:heterotetrameric sarcosine oxidase delta subunit
MFVIKCPNCGARDLSEFSYGGEAHISRPEWRDEMSDAEWAEFVFMRTNPKGVFAERWNHAAGCRRWFNMLRNTATDDILTVYGLDEESPEVAANLPATPSGESTIGSGNDEAKVIDAGEAAGGGGAP